MKEVFTKKFWQGVKRTFDEAREGAPPEHKAVDAPAQAIPQDSSSAAAASSPPAPNEQARPPG